MIRAAHLMGTENLLVVPGAVFIPWMKDVKEIPLEVVDRRAREAVAKLVPEAEGLEPCYTLDAAAGTWQTPVRIVTQERGGLLQRIPRQTL